LEIPHSVVFDRTEDRISVERVGSIVARMITPAIDTHGGASLRCARSHASEV